MPGGAPFDVAAGRPDACQRLAMPATHVAMMRPARAADAWQPSPAPPVPRPTAPEPTTPRPQARWRSAPKDYDAFIRFPGGPEVRFGMKLVAA
ncbi:MAG: hypothetical protein VKQ33_01750 [Candidatus Sericytochromatia bacterium]|nr:hypothetical protein [Candidatus Sericytochromatia bacterium]